MSEGRVMKALVLDLLQPSLCEVSIESIRVPGLPDDDVQPLTSRVPVTVAPVDLGNLESKCLERGRLG